MKGKHSLLKAWMGTPCFGPTTRTLGADAYVRPRTLVAYRITWVSGVVLHASHQLYAFKGLVFCNVCGFVAGHSVQKHRIPSGQGLDNIPTRKGAENIDRILERTIALVHALVAS